MKRRVVLLAAIAVVLLATPASAHVHVHPDEAPAGSTATFTFEVPNEKGDAATVEVALQSPAPVVRAESPTGWSSSVDGDVVTWTGGRLTGEQEGSFVVTVGPLPASEQQVLFKVVQTYDDGSVERWIDEPLASGEEPEHPAPVVRLTPAALSTSTSTSTTAPTTTTAEPLPDDGSNLLVRGALLVAVALFGLGAVLAIRRRG